MQKLIRFVLNYLILGYTESYLAEMLGVKELAQSMPFSLPDDEKILYAVKQSVIHRMNGDSEFEFVLMGVMAQQVDFLSEPKLQRNLEGARKVSIKIKDGISYAIMVYADGTWHFMVPSYCVKTEDDAR